MLNIKLTESQRLSRAAMDLMNVPRLQPLCALIMLGTRKVKKGLPTARTDGMNEEYGEEFIARISDAELRATIMHELGHKMFRHLITWKHLWAIDPDRANRAADYIVNLWVHDEIAGGVDGYMPDWWCYDEKYRGWSTERVFHDLKGGGGGGKPTDDHDWEKAKDMTAQEEQELSRQIEEALREGALAASKSGSGGSRVVDGILEAKVDWRAALREFVIATTSGKDSATWARPNRRFVGSGFYMPSGISEKLGEIVVGVDTSGTIGEKEVAQFLGEVVSMCGSVQFEQLRLLYWDTQICREEVYQTHEASTLLQNTRPAGGGGTSPSCVADYVNTLPKRPQVVVMFTDGYVGHWGNWTVPVIWCVVNNSSARAPVGKTVHVERD